MEEVFSADGVHRAHHLADANLLAGFYGNGFELAVQGEIFPVVHQYALVVAGQHHNLRDSAVKDGLCLGAVLYHQRDAVVLGQLDILIDGVAVFAEAFHYGSLHRPGQSALVGGKLVGKFGVHGGRGGLGTASAGLFPGLALLPRLLADELRNFAVQLFLLPVLLLELFLVGAAVFFELRHHAGCVALFALQLRTLAHHLLAGFVHLGLEFVQALFLRFQLGRCLPQFERLRAHLRGKVAEVVKTVEGLPHGVAGQDIHVPQAGVPVLVCAPHQAGVIEGEGVVTGLQAAQFLLAQVQRVVQLFELLVISGDELLPGIDFPSYQGKAAQDFVAVFDVLVQLAVQDFDVVLQLGAQRLQAFDRRALCSGAQGREDGYQHYAEDFLHSLSGSRRAAWFL